MGVLEPIGQAVRIGVDLGQRTDFTAIVVVEVQRRGYTLLSGAGGPIPQGGRWVYVARTIERPPLGTSYPVVVERLLKINRKLTEMKQRNRHFLVDATGVGQPIVDQLRRERLRTAPVYITNSEQAKWEKGELHLGKAALVSRLQLLLQSGRILLPAGDAQTSAMVEELRNYEIKISDAMRAAFGVFKVGAHDDLVTALGLACWEEWPRYRISAGGQSWEA